MQRLLVISALVLASAFVVDITSAPKPLAGRLGSSPVVVELFTSQGCSSCPPADELLGRIARDPALRGRVIPLAFHVDYWNHLGWRDPFSTPEWSQRQLSYVRAFGISGAYTPQAVVNGSRQLIGSSAGPLFDAIEQESKRTAIASMSIRDGFVRVDAPRTLELIALAIDDSQSTNVARGENEGRTLVNDAIVKKLVRLGSVQGSVERALPEGTTVVLLQDSKTMRIEACAVVSAAGRATPDTHRYSLPSAGAQGPP